MPATKTNDHGLTFKQEKFVLRYVSHGIESRAYAEAFNVNKKRKETWVRKEACILLQKPEIQARIAQLHKLDETSAVYDHRQCLMEAHEAFLMAKEAGDARGMVAAAQLKAKISGLVIDTSVQLKRDVGDMSNDDVARELERINEQLRALGHQPLPALPAPAAGGEGPRVIAGEFKEIHRERVASD